MKLQTLARLKTVVLLAVLLLPGMTGALAENYERKTFELRKGGSELVKTGYSFKRISVADPTIADVLVLSPREFYVYGKQTGFTSMILWDEQESRTLLDVLVSVDPTALKKKIHELFPNEDISVTSSETGVVLSGTVSGPEVVEQVLRLTERFLTKQAEAKKGSTGTGQSGTGITNLLKISGPQQVLLEVKFAEVNRNSARELQAGFTLAGLGSDFKAGVGSSILSAGNSIAGSAGNLSLNRPLLPNVFVSIDNFALYLRFLEEERLGRVLAEPKLMTMSGQEASFLAGGEFPFQTVDQDGQSDTEFKEFGVGLRFTPIVGSDGTITLRVFPSVSDIADFIDTSTGPQPFFNTRKLETTVQLRDGQTLALAGLLQDNLTEVVNKVPFLGNIPILGTLFRSTDYQSRKTDLLVAVTPHLVRPVKEGELSFPGEFIKTPNRFEFYLEGMLEGRRSADDRSALSEHAFAALSAANGGGLEGQFGHTEVK